jgi:predicted regulator of Ras-like GTPase activity (Roadblock/LC7/MglB family)
MIQTILVLKRTGENICSKTYGDAKWNETLTSGFISAAFNFTEKTFGSEIDDIELGPYKVLFEVTDDIILVAFTEKSDSIINIREKLIEIKEIIYEKYATALKNKLCSPDEFDGLKEIIDKIVSESLELDLKESIKEQYKDILESFRGNEEILDCDLISSSGVPLAKEWKRDFLDLCLRMIDAFWKSKQYVLDQIILSYEERNLILHKINQKFVLSALVRRNTPLGLATFLVEETANIMAKVD